MRIIRIKCPDCKKPFQIDTNEEKTICPYCGHVHKTEDLIDINNRNKKYVSDKEAENLTIHKTIKNDSLLRNVNINNTENIEHLSNEIETMSRDSHVFNRKCDWPYEELKENNKFNSENENKKSNLILTKVGFLIKLVLICFTIFIIYKLSTNMLHVLEQNLTENVNYNTFSISETTNENDLSFQKKLEESVDAGSNYFINETTQPDGYYYSESVEFTSESHDGNNYIVEANDNDNSDSDSDSESYHIIQPDTQNISSNKELKIKGSEPIGIDIAWKDYSFHNLLEAVITNIKEDGAAYKQGLYVGDIITAINGKPITSKTELFNAMDDHVIGDDYVFTVKRNINNTIEEFTIPIHMK